MYSVKVHQEEDVYLWIDRLEKPGFPYKAGVTLIYNPLITNKEFGVAMGNRLRTIRKTVLEHIDITVPGVHHSTPQQNKAGFLFPPEDYTQVGVPASMTSVSSVASIMDSTVRNVGDHYPDVTTSAPIMSTGSNTAANVDQRLVSPPHVPPPLQLGPTPQSLRGGPSG